MFYDGPPGLTVDLTPPSNNGVDLLYSHEYVAAEMARRNPNAYIYANNNPLRYVDPSGLLATTELPCPQLCRGPQCQFELDAFEGQRTFPLQGGEQGPTAPAPAFIVAMRHRPRRPRNRNELGNNECGYPIACYGGFDRDVGGGGSFIRFLLRDGTSCELTRGSFPPLSPVPNPPTTPREQKCRSVYDFGSPEDATWDGAEYRFKKSLVAGVHAKVAIITECICGTGDVEIPGVDRPAARALGSIKIDIKLGRGF